MSNTNYFVVELRFPYRVEKSKTPEAAANEAIRQFKDQYGFAPSRWNARVFEFSNKKDAVGPQREWAFSPNGVTCFDIAKNLNER